MTSKSNIRICVNASGQMSRLLTLKERRNGDLVVGLVAAEFYREAGQFNVDEKRRIVAQKYSVHRSLKSAEDINARYNQKLWMRS